MSPFLVSAAFAWEPAEVRPIPLDRAFAASPAWDGGPAWFAGGEEGLLALEPGPGAELARSAALHPRALVVRDLDGSGEPELLACGPEGIALVRGRRQGFSLPRPLSDVPCGSLVAYDLERYPALATVVEGRLTSWAPTAQGLVRGDLGVPAAPEGPLAASGRRVAVVDPEGDLRLTEPAEELPGPVVAVAATPEGFAWLVGSELRRTGAEPLALDAPATGLASGGGELWLLDGPGKRLRPVSSPTWTALPFAPARADVVDPDGDGCPDLVVGSGGAEGALVVGRCVPPDVIVPEEPAIGALPPVVDPAVAAAPDLPFADAYGVDPGLLHRAPAEMEVGGAWKVLDVRVGEGIATRLTWGGTERRWRSRGGPPGFSVLQDGTVEYFASDPEDVGRWRVAVRTTGSGIGPRWSGFEVHVWPEETPMDGEPVPAREIAGAGSVTRRPLFPGLETWLGLGVAGGVAETNGSGWESLGESPVRGGVSPMGVLGFSSAPRTLSGWLSVDSAPFVEYAASPNDRAHAFAVALGVDTGSETFRVGPYGTYGYSLRGIGVRAVTLPWKDFRGRPTGLELRGLWLAPQLGVEGTVSWIWKI